ncbi:MAG: hypothetical protein WAX07_00660 [Candidatus Altiarchaeia archaeon]
MENTKPAVVSWVVTSVLLLVATFYDFLNGNNFGIPGTIFFVSITAYFTAYLVYRKK